jgi:hypothetical protein
MAEQRQMEEEAALHRVRMNKIIKRGRALETADSSSPAPSRKSKRKKKHKSSKKRKSQKSRRKKK